MKVLLGLFVFIYGNYTNSQKNGEIQKNDFRQNYRRFGYNLQQEQFFFVYYVYPYLYGNHTSSAYKKNGKNQ
jgi:hypothetical protein